MERSLFSGLHGGPGDAALPLVLKYNQALEKNFTVVVWEQQGAGKSYYPFAEDTPVTIETFLQDLYFLVRYLLERFRQERLYLWGIPGETSWDYTLFNAIRSISVLISAADR